MLPLPSWNPYCAATALASAAYPEVPLVAAAIAAASAAFCIARWRRYQSETSAESPIAPTRAGRQSATRIMVAPLWFAANARTIPVPLRRCTTVRESLAIDAIGSLDIGRPVRDLRMGLAGHGRATGDCAPGAFFPKPTQSPFMADPLSGRIRGGKIPISPLRAA